MTDLIADLRRWAAAREGRNTPGGHGTTGTAKLRAAADELEALTGRVEQTEGLLRREWWLRHGCDFIALYGDDGEMSCGSCFTDFKHMPIVELQTRVLTLRARAHQIPPE